MKLNRSADGVRLFPEVRIRVFFENNSGSKLNKLRAAPGTGYTAAAIEKILEDAAGQVEKNFPSFEYELVEIGPADFNFVWRGYRTRVIA
jgi:hypothetical protein